ncbi:hypothetical protein [Kordia jejudonensis]|uniref:hypothetical protein n=1 Tax=Kordia jejudonensis TaxID=1348245 RepID=UPI000629A68A|nr:hypothetical protein [Kordia jejudonensis]
MKKLEKILAVTIIAFMVLRLFTAFPYSSMILTLSTLLLVLLYTTFGFALLNGISFRSFLKKESFKGISIWRMIGIIGTGWVLSIVIIGILFVFQRWPYGYINLQNGLIFTGIIVIVIVLKKGISFHKVYSYILLRIGITGLIGLFLLYLPQETLLEMQCKDCSTSYLEAEKALLKDPNNKELQEKAYQEYIKMDKAEEERKQ